MSANPEGKIVDENTIERIFGDAAYSIEYPALLTVGSGKGAILIPALGDQTIVYRKSRTKIGEDPASGEVWQATDREITHLVEGHLRSVRLMGLIKDPDEPSIRFVFNPPSPNVLVQGSEIDYSAPEIFEQMRNGLKTIRLFGVEVEGVDTD